MTAPQRASLFPREHGAWAMLLQPFLGALIVLHRLAWPVLPALAAAILIFLVREPVLALARQKWVWRGPRPETAEARRYLRTELPLLTLCGALLLIVWPWWWLALLGVFAGTLTGLAVWMTVRNRQRAIWLQALSAAGLSGSGLAACLAVMGTVPAWGWWFWGLHSAHFLAGILVVHARLEARIAARKGASALTPDFLAMRKEAAWVQAALSAAAIALFAAGKPLYGAAMALSAAVHLGDLYSAHAPRALALPMSAVGRRALAVSITFTLLLVAGVLYNHS